MSEKQRSWKEERSTLVLVGFETALGINEEVRKNYILNFDATFLSIK